MTRRERIPWGSSRSYYSLLGRRDAGERFEVTLVHHHAGCHTTRTVVVPPEKYGMMVDLITANTFTFFRQSRVAHDRTLRPLERFIRAHELVLPECV